MAVLQLSTCHHKSSGNKLQTIVFDGEINSESSHICAGFSPVCIHMEVKKQSVYHHQNSENYFCHYSHVWSMNNFCQQQLFGELLTSMCSHGMEKLSASRHQNRDNKIFITNKFVGWEHSESTCNCAGFFPVCILMAVLLEHMSPSE